MCDVIWMAVEFKLNLSVEINWNRSFFFLTGTCDGVAHAKNLLISTKIAHIHLHWMKWLVLCDMTTDGLLIITYYVGS